MKQMKQIIAFLICLIIILSDLAVPSIVKGASTVPQETKQVRELRLHNKGSFNH